MVALQLREVVGHVRMLDRLARDIGQQILLRDIGDVVAGLVLGEQMIEQGDGGAIVNIGSTSGFRGRDTAIAYAAAKGGVANLMRAIAIQLAPFKIRVNSVVPNKIGSPVGQQDFDPSRPVPNLVGRAGLPQELAKGVLFLASEDASFVFGENLFVDGGYSAMM